MNPALPKFNLIDVKIPNSTQNALYLKSLEGRDEDTPQQF